MLAGHVRLDQQFNRMNVKFHDDNGSLRN
jgi:hypothetical protein